MGSLDGSNHRGRRPTARCLQADVVIGQPGTVQRCLHRPPVGWIAVPVHGEVEGAGRLIRPHHTDLSAEGDQRRNLAVRRGSEAGGRRNDERSDPGPALVVGVGEEDSRGGSERDPQPPGGVLGDRRRVL